MENKLICKAEECVNNMGGFCTARVINMIGVLAREKEDVKCSTFGERTITEALKNATNLNLGGAFAQAFNTEKIEISPEVLCSAEKCIYNHKKKCVAKDVFVNENALTSVGSPYCETFKENK